MKVINDFFMKNLGWKIFSLGLSITLWFLVINIENPPDTKTYNIKVSVTGEDKLEDGHYVIANRNEINNTYVNVKVKGNRLSLEALDKRKNDIEVVADLQEVIFRLNDENKSISVPVDVHLPNIESIEVLERTPRALSIALENLVSEEREVHVITTGKPADGFIALAPEVTPESIIISGAESNVDQVASVTVNVDLANASGAISVTGQPKLYDANENEITIVKKNVESVAISVPIHKNKRIPVSDVFIQGVPESGYTISSIEKSVEYIEVVGSPEAVDDLDIFDLPVINVEGRSQSYEARFDARTYLTPNISIRNGTPNVVTVKINMEREIVKEIIIEPNGVNITGINDPTKQITVLPDPVILNIKGIESAISPLNADDIPVSADLSSYEDGSFTIPVHYELPPGITQLGDSPAVKVEIMTIDSTEDIPPEEEEEEEE